MTPEVFDGFLLGAIGVCAAGALLNLAMVKKRGLNAILMAISFLLLGLAVTMYRIGAPSFVVAGVGVLFFGTLIAEFLIRAKNQGSRS